MNSSRPHPGTSLLTRPTLLFRVREWQDAASWAEFHRLYRRLIYGRARRAGLAHEDAEDVAQDVFKRVAETIKDFDLNPDRGSFRGWLMKLTHWRIADQFERRGKLPAHTPASPRDSSTGGARRRSSACPRRPTTRTSGTRSGSATFCRPRSSASRAR
ncbi:MAG: sigma-70 family RNA polymerase sigma factor [Opitutaceae bacterium]|nr:sigma-70 family RNA polymerase sigma factor [Opitutaceae bacterium]